MSPLTPLGKPLSQSPPAGVNAPLPAPPMGAGQPPISAFQWISLAKAAWTWILRPLWYLCFKWPSQLILAPLKGSDDSDLQRQQEIRIRRDQREDRQKSW